MPILRMAGGELELFEQSLLGPDAVRYLWINAYSQVGVIFMVDELERILSRIGIGIGTGPAWDWVRVRKELDEELRTQACVRAAHGIIVEINGPCLVSRSVIARRPRVDVGTPIGPYKGALPELHSVADAATRQLLWLNDGVLVTGDERRRAYSRAPRRS